MHYLPCVAALAVCLTGPVRAAENADPATRDPRPPANQQPVAHLATGSDWLNLLRDKPWSLTFDIATEYKTDLALPLELGPAQTHPRSDECRLKLAGNFDYRIPIGPGNLILGYGLNQTMHSDTEEIDAQIHNASAKYRWHPWTGATAIAWMGFSHALLEYESLATNYRTGASLYAHEFGPLFGRISYEFTCLDHHINEGFDSGTHAVTLAQVIRLWDPRNTVTVGYRVRKRNADASMYSFCGHNAFVSTRWWVCDNAWLTGNVAYGFDRYDGQDVIDLKHRRDRTLRLGLRFDCAVTECCTVYCGVSWADRASNIGRQSFQSTTVTIGTIFRL